MRMPFRHSVCSASLNAPEYALILFAVVLLRTILSCVSECGVCVYTRCHYLCCITSKFYKCITHFVAFACPFKFFSLFLTVGLIAFFVGYLLFFCVFFFSFFAAKRRLSEIILFSSLRLIYLLLDQTFGNNIISDRAGNDDTFCGRFVTTNQPHRCTSSNALK